MNQPLALLSLYNIKMQESTSFQKVLERKDELDIIIVDNTTIDETRRYNEYVAKQIDICYLSKQKNIGLSRGYNLAIDYIKKNNVSAKWIVTLDQDTLLADSYFDSIQDIINQSTDSYIYYPQVEASGNLISPIPMKKYFHGKAGRKANARNIACINSGLLIDIVFFQGFAYDESLFLDMVDYDLFCTIIETGYASKVSSMGA